MEGTGSDQPTADTASGKPAAETKPNRGHRWRAVAVWVSQQLRRHGSSIVLFVVGVLCLAAAIWIVPDRQAVATALVAFGVAQVVLSAILSRAEGPTRITSRGVETILRPVLIKAREYGLNDEQAAEAAAFALLMMPEPERGSRDLISFGWSPQRLASVLNVTDPESIAESAVWGVLLAERERGGREADKSDESPSS